MLGTRDGKTEKKELGMVKKGKLAGRSAKDKIVIIDFVKKHNAKFCTTWGGLKSLDKYSRRAKNFLGYSATCKDCQREADRKYQNTERGYMMLLWNSIKKRTKIKKLNSTITSFDQFFDLWQKQKSERGLICPYSGREMTLKKILRMHEKGNLGRIVTNVSVDRIDGDIGYQPNNIIFCSWYANNMKNNITFEVARNFVRVYIERYHDLFKE